MSEAPDLSSELQRLHQLHKSGALTDDEYRAAKEATIGSSSKPVEAVSPPSHTNSGKFSDTAGCLIFLAIIGGAAWLFSTVMQSIPPMLRGGIVIAVLVGGGVYRLATQGRSQP